MYAQVSGEDMGYGRYEYSCMGLSLMQITIIRLAYYSKINIGVFYLKSTFTVIPQAVDLYSDDKFKCTEAILLSPEINTWQV